ncbi:MAG: dihydrofolate reductase [Bacteroidales bacterium]
MLSMIVAAAENNAIGKDNKLLWHLPDDLKHFKNTTKGHHIIMGRKTFESNGRPLPKRTNIIITKNKDFTADGCLIVHSIDEALEIAKNDNEPFIIGGETIYRQAMPLAERIYLTRVHTEIEGDTFFPEIDENEWEEKSREYHEKDEKHPYPFSIITLERIR